MENNSINHIINSNNNNNSSCNNNNPDSRDLFLIIYRNVYLRSLILNYLRLNSFYNSITVEYGSLLKHLSNSNSINNINSNNSSNDNNNCNNSNDNNNNLIKKYKHYKYLKSISINIMDLKIEQIFNQISECPNIDRLRIKDHQLNHRHDIFEYFKIPNSITYLKVRYYCGTPISSTNIKKFEMLVYAGQLNATTLGSSLTSLSIYKIINQDFKFEYLPRSLLSLTIKSVDSLKIKPKSLPDSLTYLCLGGFNQVLDNILPTKLQHLCLDCDFKQDITPSLLPKLLNKFYYYGHKFSFKFYDPHQSIFKLLGFMQVPIGLFDLSRLLSLKSFLLGKDFNETIDGFEVVFPKLMKKVNLMFNKSYFEEFILPSCLESAKVTLSSLQNLPIHSITSLSIWCDFNFRGYLISPQYQQQQQEKIDERVILFITNQLSQVLSFTNLKSLSFLSISNNQINLGDFVPASVKHLEYQFSNNKNNSPFPFTIPDHIESLKINSVTSDNIPKQYPESITCLEYELKSNITIGLSNLPKRIKSLIIRSKVYIALFESLPPSLNLIIVEDNINISSKLELVCNYFNFGILKLVDFEDNKLILKYIKNLRYSKIKSIINNNNNNI